MRKQYQSRQGCSRDEYGGRRAARRMIGALAARLPLRIVVPFLLFWSLGSVVLGHELASLPLASFVSAVTRPLQATLQVQGPVPRAETRASPAKSIQVATGGLGNKLPIVASHRNAQTNSSAKGASHSQRGNSARASPARQSTDQFDVPFRGASDDWWVSGFTYGGDYGVTYSDDYGDGYSGDDYFTSSWPDSWQRGWFASPNVPRWSGDYWQSPCDWAPSFSSEWQ